ncbi:MAG TPA: DUF2752 domain-containing protein [Cyclobacteriaceae bacterium]|nr:DUF2752 domain-containing protein [Cyclobacteriaceae bacterium]
MKQILNLRAKFSFEAFFWSIGLMLLAFFNPTNSSNEMSLCLSQFVMNTNCPGCGLGHAIAYFLNGEIALSLQAHPLGILTALVLTYRIISTSFNQFNHGKSY